MKKKLCRLIMAASLPLLIQTASAQVLLTDDFVVDANSNDPNFELGNGRQTGTQILSTYNSNGGQHQVGNPGTFVGQPGGATNSHYLLLAVGGGVQSKTDIGAAATGPLTISFDMYFHASGNPNNGDPTDWGAFSLKGSSSDGFPVVGGAGEFGFLSRYNGGIQVFQNGANIAPANWDTTGFALSDHWTLTFTDTAGTGSAFRGNGSVVTIVNGTTTLGTLTLSQLNSLHLYPGFDQPNMVFVGVANFSAAVTPPTVTTNFSFEENVAPAGSTTSVVPAGWVPFNKGGGDDFGSQDAGGTDYTVYSPLAAPADGNQFCFINMFNSGVEGGIYHHVGALATNAIYTLTVAIGSRADRINSPGIIKLVNGTNNTGTILASGGGLPATQNTWQDYTATFTTGPSVSGDLTIVLSVIGAGTIQGDFDNVRLDVQQSSVPPPFLIQETLPASATAAVGSNVVFTAVFSNSPPVSFQWQQIVSGSPNVTNNINTGVVNVTNNGVVTSTLTLNNVQPASAGSYRVKAVNATNGAPVVYTSSALLTVVPTITWYPVGTGNGAFLSNSVLAFAGSPADEVYGVDFGVGPMTTANGYTFDDYTAGNMSIAGSGLGTFGGYLAGATTGDGSFDIILNNGAYGSAANTGTLNNLTIGQAYTVLVLLADTRTSGASGPNFDVTDGLTVSPVQPFAFPNGTPAVGGFIMGTFTARATTQPLTVLQNGNAAYVAILLEKGTASAPVFAPTFTTDIKPLLSEVTTGGSVTLSVVAAGSPPLQYQWASQDGPISGATNSSYVFNALEGTNSYFVGVTNAAGGIVSSTAVVIGSTNIVTVQNFSFENGTTAGPGGGTLPVSWSQAGSVNWCAVASGTYSTLPDGADFFALNEGPSDSTGGIYQDVGALLPNTTYTLTVAIGHHPSYQTSPGIILLLNGTNYSGIVLASTNCVPDASDTWQDYAVTFITGPSVSGDLTIALTVAPASTWQANFDNVRLTKAPAPSVIPPTLVTDIHPLRSEVTTGAPWTLSVTANGNPLYYQWYNQSGPISGATNSSYSFNAVAGTNSYYLGVSNSANAILSSTAVVVSAANIVTVNNFSFENGSTPAFGNGAIPVSWTDFNSDWSTVSGDTSHLSPSIVPDGTQYYGRNTGPTATTGGIYQDVGALLPNTAYTLTVAIGRRNDTGPGGDGIWSPGIISLINGANNTGTVLASTTGYPGTAGTWQDYTATFSTGASVSGDLTVALSVAPANTYQALFDDVRLTKTQIFKIGTVKVKDGNVILTGSGEANTGYTLLTTTNLSAPINWTTNTTGTLDGTGAFSNSIPVGTAPARFFRVRVP